MVIAPLVLGWTIIATVWAMLAGVQLNPASLKNDRARVKKKEAVDHWRPIGVPDETPQPCRKKNGPNTGLSGSFYFASGALADGPADLCGY